MIMLSPAPQSIECPEMSVLGPALFIIYIHDTRERRLFYVIIGGLLRYLFRNIPKAFTL